MQSYKLRTHALTPELVKTLTRDAECALISKEEGKLEFRQHYHWFIRTPVKMPAFRARIRSHGLKGNSTYSLAVLDSDFPIEYIAYLIKEGDLTDIRFPPDTLAEARKYDLAVKADIKETRAKRLTVVQRIMQEAPVTQWKDTYSRLRDEYDEKRAIDPHSTFVQHPLATMRAVVAEFVVDWYLEHSTYREFQVISTTQTILGRLFDDYREVLRTRVFEKI